MNSAVLLTTLRTTCKLYGPGRLPKADRRDIGAGYALASAAMGATLLFALIAWGLHALGSPIGSDWEFLGAWGLIALPVVVPASFVSAVIVWRMLPSDVPHFGASAGVVATVGTYLLVLLVLFTLSVVNVVVSGQYAQLPEAAACIGFIGFIALVWTVWLTLPVGAVSGIVHERVTSTGAKRA